MTPDWMTHADCADTDPALFFPEVGENDAAHEAKAICAQCPVRIACLEHALATGEVHGIWGGMNGRERQRIRRRRLEAGTLTRNCTHCGGRFRMTGSWQQLCSDECAKAARAATHARTQKANA